MIFKIIWLKNLTDKGATVIFLQIFILDIDKEIIKHYHSIHIIEESLWY